MRQCYFWIIAAFFVVFPATGWSQPPSAVYRWETAHIFQPAAPLSVYQQRRQRLLEQLPDSAFALVFSADIRNRQNDVDYEYRQNSNMLYLTGIPQPNVTLLLVPGGIVIDTASNLRVSAVVFAPPRKPHAELWTGVRLGPEEISEIYGIPALPDSLYSPVIRRLLQERTAVYLDKSPTPFLNDPLFQRRIYLRREWRKILKKRYPHIRLRSLHPLLAAMRQIKDSVEIALLRRAVAITIEGHRAAMRAAAPGIYEYQLENVMECTFRDLGAEAVGYPSIVGSGPNTCILHYSTNRRKTQDGDLVLMDCGAEYRGYTADITRTFPVNGRFSPAQRALYQLVVRAQDSAFAHCQPGKPFSAPHEAARRVITQGLLDLGIITDPEQVRWYFPHYTSHFLGLDVHDVSTSRTLQPGMVITVEPGIYIPEGSPCDPKWWNIGIRIEEDVLITESGYEILSAGLERTVEEIETLMSKEAKNTD